MDASDRHNDVMLIFEKPYKSANIQRTDFYLAHFQSLGSLVLR